MIITGMRTSAKKIKTSQSTRFTGTPFLSITTDYLPIQTLTFELSGDAKDDFPPQLLLELDKYRRV